MPSHARRTAATALVLLAAPASASAHVSFHPNAIPQGSYATLNVRVPNEEDAANTTSIRMQLPAGVLSALGQPPAGWTFRAKTRKLATPVKTDDGTISTEVTEVDFSGGKIPPGQFADFPVTLSLPDAAKTGQVVAFPTIQAYSNGDVVRWIGAASDDKPAPTIDVTAPGTALLDVSGGDAGPPAKLPAGLAGPPSARSPEAAATPATRTVVKQQSKGLAIVALVVGVLGVGVGAAALATRRGVATVSRP